LRARSAMEPASRRATSSDRTSCRKPAWGMLFWRARVRRSGKVAVSLPSLRARRVALRSGPSGSVSDGMVFLPVRVDGAGRRGGAGCGLGVTFAGGIGADVVVFGAGVGFGLPGPDGLGLGVVAGLAGGG